jgi:hypothetical protein
MSLVDCQDCGNKISTRANACPHCGAPGQATVVSENDVRIRFAIWPGQVFNNDCEVSANGKVIASCRQGETASFELAGETEIQIKMGGGFGKPKTIAKPGDRFEVGFRGLGKVYIAKVDTLT